MSQLITKGALYASLPVISASHQLKMQSQNSPKCQGIAGELFVALRSMPQNP